MFFTLRIWLSEFLSIVNIEPHAGATQQSSISMVLPTSTIWDWYSLLSRAFRLFTNLWVSLYNSKIYISKKCRLSATRTIFPFYTAFPPSTALLIIGFDRDFPSPILTTSIRHSTLHTHRAVKISTIGRYTLFK